MYVAVPPDGQVGGAVPPDGPVGAAVPPDGRSAGGLLDGLAGGRAVPVTLPLARVLTRAFPARGEFGAAGLRILTDLADSYHLPGSAGQLRGRRRTTFTDMVATLVGELTDTADPAGLVVLAHGLADAEPELPACYLAGVLPGDPLTFAVADHGVVTPFLALRVAAEYIRAESLRRAVVLILEQPSLLRDPRVSTDLPPPAENRVVALVFDDAGSAGLLTVDSVPDVGARHARRLVRDRIDAADPGDVTVVGGRLAAGGTPGWARGAVLAPAGRPGTGPWVALAEGLPRWRAAGTRRITLVDHDPRLRVLGACVLDPVAAATPRPLAGRATMEMRS